MTEEHKLCLKAQGFKEDVEPKNIRDINAVDNKLDAYKIGRYDGYIAGYHECQKEHEWHYVKDGDLPKDEKDMLMSEQLILLTRMKGTDNLNISIGQYNFSTQEFSYSHIIGLTDVIAWKEIVLSKEIE